MSDSRKNLASLSWFTQSTSKYSPLIFELVVITIVLRLLGLLQPFAFQAIIDRVLPFQSEATLTLIVVTLIVATMFSAGLDAVASYLGAHMSNRLVAELARRIFHHVLSLPLRHLERWRVGETLSRISEIDTVRNFLTGTVTGIALDVIFAITYVIALYMISPLLTFIVLVILPIQIIVFTAIGPFIRQRMQETFWAEAKYQSRLVEAFGNTTTLKALASEARHAERFQEALVDSLVAGFRATKLNIANHTLGFVLENASVILVLYFGANLVLKNEITLGELVAFHLLAEKVSGPIMSLSTIWEQWQGLKIARYRLGDILNEIPEDAQPKKQLVLFDAPKLALCDVTFSYGDGEPVLNNVNLEFSPKRLTVIVGESGIGKSTLAKLLCGLYIPDTGQVNADGLDICTFDPLSVRRQVVYVPQDATLFSGTVLDNLLIGRPDATRDDIERALQASASDFVIDQLPNGLQSEVGERGSYLSGGQRQRIALARALMLDPKVLILDEPTSALDSPTEAVIVAALKEFATKKTLIVITHTPDLFSTMDVDIVDFNRVARLRTVLHG